MKRDEKAEQKLHNLLQESAFSGAEFFCYEKVSSTNDLVKEFAKGGHGEGVLVLAESQTTGRGRMGKTFLSPRECGLYMSLLLKPVENAKNPGLLTAGAAVAVRRAVMRLIGLSTEIKWVNDLYYAGKKLCGILAEGEVGGKGTLETVVLGIGINLTAPEEGYAPEICGQAISLTEMTGTALTFDRLDLCAEIVKAFEEIYKELPRVDFLEEYRAASCVLGKQISYQKDGKRHEGLAIGIDDEACLLIEAGGKTETLGTGEISLVRPL